jgi:hypothetical protein
VNKLKKIRMFLLLLLFTLSSCINMGELENTVVLEAGRYRNEYPYGEPNSESTHSTLDLDSGAIGNLDEADIWFIGDGGSNDFYLIGNITGSLSKYMGFDEPGYEGCLAVIEELTPGHVPDWREGGYICVLTGEGRLSQVKTEDIYNEGNNVMLKVSFITWDQIIDVESE